MNTERTYTLEEQKANRKLWVEALRSGEYQQVPSELFGGAGYCCLGVLCRVAGLSDETIENCGALHGFVGVRRFVGLADPEGAYGDDSYLVRDNDEGKTFAEIADIIESEPAGLFISEGKQ